MTRPANCLHDDLSVQARHRGSTSFRSARIVSERCPLSGRGIRAGCRSPTRMIRGGWMGGRRKRQVDDEWGARDGTRAGGARGHASRVWRLQLQPPSVRPPSSPPRNFPLCLPSPDPSPLPFSTITAMHAPPRLPQTLKEPSPSAPSQTTHAPSPLPTDPAARAPVARTWAYPRAVHLLTLCPNSNVLSLLS